MLVPGKAKTRVPSVNYVGAYFVTMVTLDNAYENKNMQGEKELTWSTLKPNYKAHRKQQDRCYVDTVTNEKIFLTDMSLSI